MTPRQQASVPGEFLAALREVATEAIALRAVAAK
jgi:hypothetical protein